MTEFKYVPLKLKEAMADALDAIYSEVGPCRLIIDLNPREHNITAQNMAGYNRKFGDETIQKIHHLYNTGNDSYAKIAKQIGCSSSFVGAVIRGERRNIY